MRKFTLLLCACLISMASMAQVATHKAKLFLPEDFSKLKTAKFRAPGSENDLSSHVWLPSPYSSLREEEAIIGNTAHDFQTNGSISSRMHNNGDGTLSAGWITICPGASSSTRGTGYNYFDGTTWTLPADCDRLEPANRTGYTAMGITATGKEMVLGHSSTAGGMIITSRPTKGTGDWSEDLTAIGGFPNDTWARMAVGGSDGKTIHAIWNPTGISSEMWCDQESPTVYSRSTDEGATWPIFRQCIDLIGIDDYLGFGAEDYAIAAQGNNVAILMSNSVTDIILLKSTDNGDTWTKTIIKPFPIPLFDPNTMVLDTNSDGEQDIYPGPGSDGILAFDNSGMIHVAYTETFITSDGTGLSYYPDADGGLWYWNEGMGSNAPVLIAAAEDLDGDGYLSYPVGSGDGSYYGSGTYGEGLTMQPTIGFDEANRIYVTYSTYNELADTTAYLCGHRHTYLIASYDGGESWTVPYNVVPTIEEGGDGENQEAVYANMARVVDSYAHIIYQRDPAPGTAILGTSAEASWNTYVNDIVYVKVQLGELTGINEVKPNLFTLSQNNPNPFSDQTQFTIALNAASQITVKVTNMVGQEVYAETASYSAGVHPYTFSKGDLSSGIYHFTIMADGQQITRKMVIE
jgi:hypothetical protein